MRTGSAGPSVPSRGGGTSDRIHRGRGRRSLEGKPRAHVEQGVCEAGVDVEGWKRMFRGVGGSGGPRSPPPRLAQARTSPKRLGEVGVPMDRGSATGIGLRPRGAPPPAPPRSFLTERGEFDCGQRAFLSSAIPHPPAPSPGKLRRERGRIRLRFGRLFLTEGRGRGCPLFAPGSPSRTRAGAVYPLSPAVCGRGQARNEPGEGTTPWWCSNSGSRTGWLRRRCCSTQPCAGPSRRRRWWYNSHFASGPRLSRVWGA